MTAADNIHGGQFQAHLFDPSEAHAREFEPVAHAIEGVKRYAAAQGHEFHPEALASRQVSHRLGGAVAAEYAQREQAPPSSRTTASFLAMRDTINRQYEHMTRPEEQGGMGIKVEIHHGETYSSPAEMAEDVRTNRRIKVQSTQSTSGLAEGAHALFSNEENDRFRAVHDVFAHSTTGRGFSRHGEDAAYLAHRQTFPKEAHEALASETRGQNMQMNYGTGEFVGVGEPQRIVGMPAWAVRPESRGPRAAPRAKPSVLQQRLFDA